MCFLADPQYSGAPAPGQGGTILPGGGAINPFNPNSDAGKTFAGVGELNIFNPNSDVGKAANDLAKDLGTTVQAIANDPKKLAAVGLMIAFPGAASAVGQFLLPAGASAALGATGTAIIGQTAINIAANGGDVKQGVISALIQQGAPQLTKYVADSYASEGVSKAVTNWAAKATVDAGIATAMGKDPTSALLFSGTKAATNALMESTGINDSLKNLPDSASSAVRAAITAKVMNIDPSKAVAQDLMNSAISGARTMYSAQQKAVENNIPPLTEQQLASIPAGTSDAGLRNIVDYQAYAKQKGFEPTSDEIARLASLTTQQRGGGFFGGLSSVIVPNSQALSDFYQEKEAEFSAQQAAIDEQNRADAEAVAQAQAQADEQAAIDAEVIAQAKAQEDAQAQAAIDEQNRLDEEARRTVGALPTEPILDDEFEPPSALPTVPILDDEFEPPSTLPTEPILDDELEPPSTLPTEPILDNELEPSCPDGYVFDRDSNSCVPVSDDPTKPTSPLPSTPINPRTPTATPTTTPTTSTTPTGGLPATTQTAQNPLGNIPWLDTKPQMLETKKAPSVMNPYEPLRQLYDNVDPTLMNVLAERGISPEGYAAGSSVSSVLSQFSSELDKSLPKFAESKNPFLSTGSRKATSTEPAKLPQLKSGLTGHAKGGLPEKYAKAAPKGHNPEFITGLTGFYANGRGTGQSDDIPAMLHDGDYVMDADTVAALGDGSSKAGALTLANFQGQVPHQYKEGGNAVPAKIADGEYVFPEPLVTALGGGDNKKGAQMLDAMREEIRAHKRSAPTSKIPPKALSPLDYLKRVEPRKKT